jgi:hypothetical protein
MGLPRAALRVLRYEILQGDAPELRREQAQCQLDLAHREFILAGRTSRFRACAAAASAGSGVADKKQQTSASENHTPDVWKQAVASYLAGNLQHALELLGGVDPEARYARASILLEGGNSAAAQSLLASLAEEHDGYLHLLARQLQDSLTFRL